MNKRIIYLFSYVLLASIIVYFLKPAYLYSILIVIVPPAIINFLWLKKSRKKILIFSLSATFLFGFAIELVSRLADSWDVQSSLPRIFGILPLENILFAFINFFWVLTFYEYFVDRKSMNNFSKRFKYLIILFSTFTLIVFLLYFYNPEIISLDYPIVGLFVLLIPSILIFSKNPGLLKKTILPVIFFSLIFFIYELVSLLIGSWWWPGEYILPISLFGHIFPLDDVIIWYILSTITLIGGYEFFADNFK